MNAAEALRSEPFAVFDTETTGVDVENDRIVSAYVALVAPNGEIIESNSWLIDPGIPIPDEAAAVHGYTTERIRAEGDPDVASSIRLLANTLASTRRHPLVVMNAPFDLTLLDREVRRHRAGIVDPESGPEGLWWWPEPVLDPLVLDKAIDPYRRGKRTLTALCEVYGIQLEQAHAAESDARAAGALARILLEQTLAKAGDDGTVTLEDVHRWQTAWKSRQQDSLRDYFIREGKLDAAQTVRGDWPIYEEH